MVSGTEWLAILAGAAAIAWVNWYFFFAGRSLATAAAASTSGTGPQVQTITVDGGYSPSTVRVQVGRPVRLVFDRRDAGSCSEEIVFPDFGIRRFLPTGEKTVIEITPDHAGRFAFTCGMSMLKGSLIAENGGTAQ